MIRRIALLVPCVALAACGGEVADDDRVVAVAQDGVVQPEAWAPASPGPTPFNPCLVLTPAFPPPAAGDVDTSFGCAGVTTYAKAGIDITVKAIAVQTDDKIVAVGEALDGGNNHREVWVARFTSAGVLDTTFATGGVFTRSFVPFGGPTSGEAVVVQPSGAIVVGGGFWSEDTPGAVRTGFFLRLLAGGTLDPAFGTAGVVETTGMSYVRALRLQTNGSIVAAGDKCAAASFDCVAAVGRLSGVDGIPDAAFGTGGFATTNYGASAPSIGRGAAVSGNDVVIAGRTTSGSETNAGLARYGATGLASSFGTGGLATYDTSDTETANGIAGIGTGFVFVESMTQSANTYFQLVRIGSTGALTSSFGIGGKVAVTFAGYGAQGYGVVVTPGNKIVAVGSARTSAGRDRIAITRLHSNGTLDTAFSDDGHTMLAGGGVDAMAYAVALQSTGKIVAAGWTRPSAGAVKRAVLVRVRSE